MPLITSQEIEEIFSSSFFYESSSIYIIDKNIKTYRTDKQYLNLIDYADSVRKAFLSGHTIIVKKMETFNKAIKNKCLDYGPDVDVHMYIVPPGGESSFDFHVDDRDVWVHMVYGEKDFILRKKEGSSFEEKSFNLKQGDSLFIAKGIEHKALPKGASCLLSFGIAPPNLNYKIGRGITASDLGTNPISF